MLKKAKREEMTSNGREVVNSGGGGELREEEQQSEKEKEEVGEGEREAKTGNGIRKPSEVSVKISLILLVHVSHTATETMCGLSPVSGRLLTQDLPRRP